MNEPTTANVTGYSVEVGQSHAPMSTDAVVSLVKAARLRGEALYPISCGLNWGYGSASPVVAGCSLVYLGGMREIRNAAAISLANPVALIEPGVTQGQLYEFLQKNCPELTFNVSGAGRDTSILGNALDRGVGYFGPRREDLLGLEVVTGTGQVLKTGFRRLGDESPLSGCHPYGLGPILDGLFFQSNFGIVTSAYLRLIPRRPKEIGVSIELRQEGKLPAFIETLAALKREGIITSVTHIGNRERSHSTLLPGVAHYLTEQCGLSADDAWQEAQAALDMLAPAKWSCLASITGNAGQVRGALAELGRRIRPLAAVNIVTEKRLAAGYAITHQLRILRPVRAVAAVIAAIKPLYGLALGVPTDIAITSLLWKFGAPELPPAELDRSDCGLLFINPALPMDGELVDKVLAGLCQVGERHGHPVYITVNVETATSMVAVINLLFLRSDPEQLARAHRCADEMLEYIHAEGLEVYRARADMMDKVVAGDPAYLGLVRDLKRQFDPDNIISPGRYGLAE